MFKNISYGRMPGSHLKAAADVFGGKIVYSPRDLGVIDALVEYEKGPVEKRKEEILALMREVRDRHTYVNRIGSIFAALDLWVNS